MAVVRDEPRQVGGLGSHNCLFPGGEEATAPMGPRVGEPGINQKSLNKEDDKPSHMLMSWKQRNLTESGT